MTDISLRKLAKILDRLASDQAGERAAAGLIASRILREAGANWNDVLANPTTLGVEHVCCSATKAPERPKKIRTHQAKIWLRFLDYRGGLKDAEQRFVWRSWMRLTREPRAELGDHDLQQLWELYWRKVISAHHDPARNRQA